MRLELAQNDSTGCGEFRGTLLDDIVDARPVIFATGRSTRVTL
jgi:hypothetical protein